ncbi:PLP-dependent transferase [Pararhodospirillum photometricum]|nr:PLP-dependent transferase [Pararhodospirillum photometricum]
MSRPHLETLALHGGVFRADPATLAVTPPVYQTTSYQFRDTDHATRLFALKEVGYTYTRTINPTREFLERRVSAVEGAKAALAVATGAAALLNAVLTLAGRGDSVVVSRDLGTGPHACLPGTLERFGLHVRWADPSDPASFARLSDASTRAWVAESLSLPRLELFPVRAVAAQAEGIPVIIDNTFLPLTVRPGDDGAAVVVYSAAEVLSGSDTTAGGLLLDTGALAWEARPERVPALNTPDPSYHGAVWTDVVRPWQASPYTARARGNPLRDLGAAISPLAAFQLLQGVETLPLRVPAQAATAAYLAEALEGHPALTGVRRTPGALVGLDFATKTQAQAFLAALTLIQARPTLGGARSAACLFALPAPRVVVLVGLEHADDVAGDLLQALKTV